MPYFTDSIISVGKKCRDIGVRNAIIFSLERRRSPRLQAKINEFYDVLMDLCTIEGFVFIHNTNLSDCDICHTSSTETKIDSSFLNQQFRIKGFCLPYRLDRNKYGG